MMAPNYKWSRCSQFHSDRRANFLRVCCSARSGQMRWGQVAAAGGGPSGIGNVKGDDLGHQRLARGAVAVFVKAAIDQ